MITPGQRKRSIRAAVLLVSASAGLALVAACSGPAHRASAGPRPPVAASSRAVSAAATVKASPTAPATPRRLRHRAIPASCRHGGPALWAHLASCGWPGPANTGPDLSQCPGGQLTANSGRRSRTIAITTPGTVISCENITGMIDIQAQNVTIRNSVVTADSGLTGENANGTAGIKVENGASATIDHVKINGSNGVHACIWHQGTNMVVSAVDCSGSDDGIWSWADSSYSGTTGDHFIIRNSYFHDFTARTSNGHEDGYQTEGASYGLIEHNTYLMTTNGDSAIAIWDGLRNASNIRVSDNLITGGGFAIYAEDYNPGDGAPGNPPAVGGFTVSNIAFTNNVFSTFAAGCVGQFGVWFSRPSWGPFAGGPTDGWHRGGNTVLETGQNIDNGNPSVNGQLCT